LVAVNVHTGQIAWKSPLGITESLPVDKQNTGRPNMGGSVATAGGLVFIAATEDAHFRAGQGRQAVCGDHRHRRLELRLPL
jgi:quinoprotein glucose dehydrogenase